jgi:hypothetical protein
VNEEFFLRPSPPHSLVHLWLGVVLSGCFLGLGGFYMQDLRGLTTAPIVLDVAPRSESPIALTQQMATLLADVKALSAELRRTQLALTAAQDRIAALEQENSSLREAQVPLASNGPPAEAAETPVSDGIGGPFIPVPKPAPAAAKASGPRACWMRANTMIATYRIAVRDDGFALSPIWDGPEGWPEEFGPAMAGFTGKRVAGPVVVSRAEFKKTMRPYYDFGMTQDTRCRFLVAVTNETSSREAWHEGLTLIDRYFFKMIHGRPDRIADDAVR